MLPTCLPVPNGNAKACLAQYHVLRSYLTQLDYSNILATWADSCLQGKKVCQRHAATAPRYLIACVQHCTVLQSCLQMMNVVLAEDRDFSELFFCDQTAPATMQGYWDIVKIW